MSAGGGAVGPALRALLNVADPRVLQRLGGEVGLPAAEVGSLLSGGDYAERVRAEWRGAAEHGVTGVPSLVIDGRPPVSGVQFPAALRQLLNLA
ncbi:DsbA family protein [Micromonospora sp. CPCC 205371]|nr:DsbA family protein [Micromonospora sp. CPCC 205371]